MPVEVLSKPIPANLQSDQSKTSAAARPQFSGKDSAEEKATKLHRHLLDLARDTDEKEARTIFRATADFFRESYFGLTDKEIKARIAAVLEEYFDGEVYRALEIENIAELSGIDKAILLPVLSRMVKRGIIEQGRRRRYNEMGEHYNPIYKLKKQ